MNYLAIKVPNLTCRLGQAKYVVFAAVLRFPETPEDKAEAQADLKGVYAYIGKPEQGGEPTFLENRGLEW